MDPEQTWFGLGHPCDAMEMELFYASINNDIMEIA
jgi:hypothetical protein